jgi:hypothetical protein
MDKKIYIGYRLGVYMQGLVAVSGNAETALMLTKEAMRLEKDSYHTFVVVEVPFNSIFSEEETIYTLGWNRSFGRYDSPDVNSPPLIIIELVGRFARYV